MSCIKKKDAGLHREVEACGRDGRKKFPMSPRKGNCAECLANLSSFLQLHWRWTDLILDDIEAAKHHPLLL